LAVRDGKDEEMASTMAIKTRTEMSRYSEVALRWRIVYCHTVKKRVKGFNKEFGFFINRPFYLESQLPLSRVLTDYSNGY